MASSLKNRAKLGLYKKRNKVALGELSVGDAASVAFTVMRMSTGTLLSASKRSKKLKIPNFPDEKEVTAIINTLITQHRGTLYAGIVTAIDSNRIFQAEKFAVGLKRLGVMDSVEAAFSGMGYAEFGKAVANYAPFFWGDFIVREIRFVKKKLTGKVNKFFNLFMREEENTTSTVDMIIETEVSQVLPAQMTFRDRLLVGALDLDTAPHIEQALTAYFRSTDTRHIKLKGSSTIDGTVASFFEHLSSGSDVYRRMLPNATFNGKKFSPSQIQQVFNNSMFKNGFKHAIVSSYDARRNSLDLSRFYQVTKSLRLDQTLKNVLYSTTGKRIDDKSSNSILTAVIGLFTSFAGDTKGQRLPFKMGS